MASGGSLNLSEETFDFLCTACEHDGKLVEAVRYCKECQGYCCQDCTNTHKRFPTLKSHTLLAATQGKPGSNRPASLPEFSTERCCTHQEKVIDMYCQHHDVVCCRSCVSKDHRSCPNSQIYSIPDMVDKLFSLSDCQTVNHNLRQLMVSMTSLGESKDDKLKALKTSKDGAVQVIATFQKALETVIKKAADKSRQELDDVYKKLEKEILQDKSVIDDTNDDLKIINTKISRAEINRVQKFVCTKIAKENIIDAESMVAEKEKNNTDVTQLSFTPNQSLMDSISGLQGIGQIGVSTKQKTDLYKIKRSQDINLKIADDSNICYVMDCCLTYDNKILVTDINNFKLKRIDIDKLKVVDYCKVDFSIVGVCCVSKNEAVVTSGHIKKIKFISIGDKMIPRRQIEMSYCCWGIASMSDKLYITDSESTLYVYDMVGNLLNTITNDNAGNKLFSNMNFATVNKRTNNLYVCDRDNGILCFDNVGNYLSPISDSDLKNVRSVCFDDKRNMFAVGAASRNVVQFNEYGKKIGVMIRQQDGLQDNPRSACFLPSQNMLFVAMESTGVMKIFELE